MKPNIDQANSGSLKGVLDAYFKTKLMEMDGMMPCSVVSYNEAGKSVTVQIMMQMQDTDGAAINRATISNVAVGTLSAGGFLIHVPIKAGDKGWIKANDCDISLYKQSLSEAIPNTIRIKSFSDGVFFPDMTEPYSPKHSGALNIQNVSGSVCVSVHEDKIMFDAPDTIINSNVEINGNTVINGDNTINGQTTANGGLTATGEGKTVINGGMDIKGGKVTHNNKNIGSDHTHSGVLSGNDDTGEPT